MSKERISWENEYPDELEREAMKEYMEHVRAKYKI